MFINNNKTFNQIYKIKNSLIYKYNNLIIKKFPNLL